MVRRKTNEEFVKQVKELVDDDYTFLEPYKNSRTKLLVRHNVCGNVYRVVPDSFLNGRRCPRCRRKEVTNKRRMSNGEFIKRVENLVGGEYSVLEPYVNSQTPILIKHNVCGHVLQMKPNSFLNGNRCKYCAHNVRLTTDEFKNRISGIYGNDYTVLGDYVNSHTPILVRHNICHHTYTVRPMNITGGQRCPYCFKTPKKTTKEFQRELNEIYGRGVYTVVSPYRGAKKKIMLKHKCGYVWGTKPNWMLSKKGGCPMCNTPHGELIINNILNDSTISYEHPKKFSDLLGVGGFPLHYDFCVDDQRVLIEYQGLQHYEPIDHFGGKEQFKKQQYHDKLKRDYAKANGYNLIEIPYTCDTYKDIKKCLIKGGLKL